jgi:hypothetical protein
MPPTSVHNARPHKPQSRKTHGLRFFTIHWRYTSALEMPRTSTVSAQTIADAKAIVMRNHLDNTSALRGAITWLDVKAND